MPTIIHTDGPENAIVEIRVKKFAEPWDITVRRAKKAPYQTTLAVTAGKRGVDLWLHFQWQTPPPPQDVQAILMRAVNARIADILPADHELVEGFPPEAGH